ncbi:hypothetical protein [Massilia aquatica]|uniref:hypothetical protein n=1 Tax=Massilia aquatica TaxID=2609000 RepID=UPI0028037CC3|nr:hypothetical protein [Massilia aquatica]
MTVPAAAAGRARGVAGGGARTSGATASAPARRRCCDSSHWASARPAAAPAWSAPNAFSRRAGGGVSPPCPPRISWASTRPARRLPSS